MSPTEYLARELERRAERAGSGFDKICLAAAKLLREQEREILALKETVK